MQFIFVRYLNVMHFINVIIFRQSNFFRVITIFWGSIVKLFTKSSKFEEGFNNNELSWSFSRSFYYVMLLSVLVQQARKFLLLDKELLLDQANIPLHSHNTLIQYWYPSLYNFYKAISLDLTLWKGFVGIYHKQKFLKIEAWIQQL